MINKNYKIHYPVTVDFAAADALCKSLADKEIFIYGAGIYGWAVKANIENAGGKAVSFCDNSYLKQTFNYFGAPVLSPLQFAEKTAQSGETAAVIIALQPGLTPSAEETKNALISLGIPREIIYILPFNKSETPVPLPIDIDSDDTDDFDKPLLPPEFYKPCTIPEDDTVCVYLRFYKDPISYIIRAVQCVREQSYKNLDIVILSNGCDEKCVSLLSKFAEIDPRIDLIISEKNTVQMEPKEYLSFLRLISERLSGDRNAVCRLDGDDYLTPDFIEKSVAAARVNNADLVICGTFFYSENEPYDMYSLTPAFYEINYTGKEEIGRFLRDFGIHFTAPWAKLFSPQIYERFQDFTQNLTEEEITKLRSSTTVSVGDITPTVFAYAGCEKITVLPGVSHFYTRRPGAMTGSGINPSHMFFRFCEALKSIKKILRNENFDEQYIDEISQFFEWHMAVSLDLKYLEMRAKTNPIDVKNALEKIKNYITEKTPESDPKRAAAIKRIDEIL
jgi:glycosyltransferase involved in cell wall biosynthesis